MGKGSLNEKNDRRDRLLGLLRSENMWTVQSLSHALSVSPRTINRDLDDLRFSGVPIEAERGRGGGVRLIGRWGIEKLSLSNSEMISLLVSLAMTECLCPSMVATHSKALRQKIALTFPEPQRKQIEQLRSRILFGAPASEAVLSGYQEPKTGLMQKLTASFFESHKLEIEYLNGAGEKTKRIVEPHYILLSWPVWYLLGWDDLRADVRLFRTDRILSLQELGEVFRRRSKPIFLQAYQDYFRSI